MGFVDILIAASMPVLKVLLITALGSYLALDSIDILGTDARKHLNIVAFYVLNPALLAANLAKTITYDSMLKLWFMPLNILITFVIGSILGLLVMHITRAPKHLRGLIVGCCAAGNLGNLPLIIIPAVCKERGSPFGDPDSCSTYGIAYASLSLAMGNIYLWTYVYNIVRVSSRSTSNCSNAVSESNNESCRKSTESDQTSCSEPLLVSQDLNVDQYVLPCTTFEGKDEVAATIISLKKHLWLFLRKIDLKKSLAPSTIGAIVGFIVGLVPQTRQVLIGNEAPLRVIQDSASLLGDAAIPSLTLIVGANLLKGLQGSGIQKSIIIGIIISRYIILPVSGIFIVKWAVQLGLVQSDSLYLFVLLIQYAVPPAMNIGAITQLFGTGENECSVILLWTYLLASISLTFWSSYFMWLVS
ncbi:protein PIN-LIKES 3-like isoform X1 [Gastrolobium bilobum]|uniref:protein PIN-LIKES 3-like isoform X1 n=1 Tax=Gastrolobium bilobum TaxID=150636 RepID=UPI002AB0FF9F|nr:protein PIN-LIKES 3-like isoform X1 [Gastrolobium bilobum]